MRASDVMTRDVSSAGLNTTLRDVASIMAARSVGCVPICDSGKLVGVITDRDIVIRVVAVGSDPNVMPAKQFMSTAVEFAFQDEEIESVAHRMETGRIRRLPVVDSDHHLVGILALGDLAQNPQSKQLSANVLEQISQREPQGQR